MRIILLVIAAIICSAVSSFAANYPLQIIQPQPNLTTASRYYKTHTGLEYRVPVGVKGGAYPFAYTLTAAPSGMTIDSETGIITWANPTESGSPHNITVSVTDSESSTVTRSWTLTVSTSGFYFVDAQSGSTVADGGQGTLLYPWRTIADVLINGSVADNTQVYFRGGTYDMTVLPGNSGSNYWIRTEVGNTKPVIWLAYPGETPVFDFGSSRYDDPEPCIRAGQPDIFFSGITFRNMWNFGFQFGAGADRLVLFDNKFESLRCGRNGENSAFVMTISGLGTLLLEYMLFQDNTLSDLYVHPANPGGAFFKTYSVSDSLYVGNTFTNINGDFSTQMEGLSLKAYVYRNEVRRNFISDISSHSIGGSFNYSDDTEIRFNRVLRANGITPGGLFLNDFQQNTGVVYAHRNTIDGAVTVRGADPGHGPFYIYSNVFINESGEADGIDCGLDSPCTDESVIVLGTGATANIVGESANNIIDPYGDLTAAYSEFVGTHGYQLTESVCDSTHLHLCFAEGTCSSAGGYWYNGICNAEDESVPVNGVCGSNNGATLSSLTSTDINNCSVGTLANFSGTGPWTWSCDGSGGGTNASCSADVVDCSIDAPLCTSRADCTTYWPDYLWCTNVCQEGPCPSWGTGNVPYSPTNFIRYSATSFAPFNP